MTSEPADVVVVGSGAGGAAAAWRLSSLGIRVLLLEAGPAYDPGSDYMLNTPEWELDAFPEKLSVVGRQTVAPLQTMDLAGDGLKSWNKHLGQRNRTKRRAFWGYHHVLGLGGSTLRFTGEAHRLHPASMQMQSRFGVAADWPVSYDELEPYYQIAERLIGVAGSSSNAGDRWRSEPYPLPPHQLCFASRKVREGCDKLGLKLVPNSRAALSEPYDGRPACNYCGQCSRGCPRTDKGSSDVTFVRRALLSGHCEVRTGAEVLRVLTGAGDRVQGVEYVDEKGVRAVVHARAVVLACGAVETPRILLNSSGSLAPEGLGNEAGEVGRHFMETVYWMSIAEHPEALGSHRGLPADAIVWDFNAPDAIPNVIGGCRFTAATMETGVAGPINYARRIVGGWGKSHKVAMKATFGRALAVGSIGECLPHPKAFIDLDPIASDNFGLPRARIHAHLDRDALARLTFMAETSRRILTASQASELIEEYGAWDNFNATHVMGGCRMGADPQKSVVNEWCRSHRWRNLFLADTSVFPSSGGGEGPALTTSALAIRTADHIRNLALRREI